MSKTSEKRSFFQIVKDRVVKDQQRIIDEQARELAESAKLVAELSEAVKKQRQELSAQRSDDSKIKSMMAELQRNAAKEKLARLTYRELQQKEAARDTANKEEAERKLREDAERAREAARQAELDKAERQREEFKEAAYELQGLYVRSVKCDDHSIKLKLSNGSRIYLWISPDDIAYEHFGVAAYVANKRVDTATLDECSGKIVSVYIVDRSTYDSSVVNEFKNRRSLIVRTTHHQYEFCIFNEHNGYYRHAYEISIDDHAITGKL